MELDRALRVFRLYCWCLVQDRQGAESLFLTDEERRAIRKLENLVKDYAGLLQTGEHNEVSARAA